MKKQLMNWVFYLFLMRLIDVISRLCIVYVYTEWHIQDFFEGGNKTKIVDDKRPSILLPIDKVINEDNN